MIDVELSNIWGSVSLPDLLSGEKDLFDAHMQLRTNMLDGPDFLGWLNAPEGVMARAVLSIGKAAEKIAELGETLVIVGSGDAPLAAQAAIRALGKEGRVRLAFAGTSLSPNAYEQLCSGLEGQDFCLLLIAQTAVDMECGVASRAVRWLLDRRYGPEAGSTFSSVRRKAASCTLWRRRRAIPSLPNLRSWAARIRRFRPPPFTDGGCRN